MSEFKAWLLPLILNQKSLILALKSNAPLAHVKRRTQAQEIV